MTKCRVVYHIYVYIYLSLKVFIPYKLEILSNNIGMIYKCINVIRKPLKINVKPYISIILYQWCSLLNF